MSATFSEIAAQALLEHCEGRPTSSKILISELHGESPVGLYAELAMKADRDVGVTLSETGSPYQMRAVSLPGGVITIPFLVCPPDERGGDPNRGSQAFNGKLRDWFDRDAPDGETRILVTFDSDPIETQLSAMDHQLDEGPLAVPALIARLRRSAKVRPSVQPVLDAVAELATGIARDSRSDVAMSAEDVASVAHLLERFEQAETPQEAGEQLNRVPWLLRDPDIAEWPIRHRLGEARKARQELEQWARSATDDFEGEVRSHYQEDIASKLIDAAALDGVDLSRFTASDLLAGRKAPPPSDPVKLVLADPVRVSGAPPAALSARDEGKRIDGAIAARSHDVRLEVRLTRPLRGTETVHFFQYAADGDSFQRQLIAVCDSESNGETPSAAVDVHLEAAPGRGRWAFVQVALSRTKTFRTKAAAEVRLAVLLPGDDQKLLAYERELDIDNDAQAFAVTDRAVLVEGKSGEWSEVGEGELPADEDVVLIGSASGLAVPLVGRSVEPDDADRSEATARSLEHFVLELHARDQWSEGAETTIRVTRDGGEVSAGAHRRFLPPVEGLERWASEASVIDQPAATVFVADDDGSVTPHPVIDAVRPDVLKTPFGAFLEARRDFFAELTAMRAGAGTPTILRGDLCTSAARRYVESYYELLAAIKDGSPWHGEYERVLLVDGIQVPGDESWMIAPTHPFHVAAHAEFQKRLGSWTSSSAENLLPGDTAGISTRWLNPFLRISGAWHESQHAPYPWRRYTRVQAPAPARRGGYVATYMQRRIRAFLSVHPGYASSRRKLTIALLNPGRAEHVIHALRGLIPRKPDDLAGLPTFELVLLAQDAAMRTTGVALERFASETLSSDAPSWQDAELLRRLIFTKRDVATWIADPQAFAHIAFAEGFVTPGDLADYSPSARPSTMYVGGLAPGMERQATVRPYEVTFVNGLWSGPGDPSSAFERAVLRANEIARSADNVNVEAGRARGLQVHVKLDQLDALYQRAAWVVHLDRHVGLELFRTEPVTGRSRYILDYSDQEDVREHGLDGVTATASVAPYLSLIRQAFSELAPGVAASDEAAAELLGWLNVMSGRWALELIKAPPSEVKEKLGSVVAYRALAEQEPAFEPGRVLRIVLALDELLRVTGRVGLRMREGWAAKFGEGGAASDDFLMLAVSLGRDTPAITGRVIEVKYRTGYVDQEAAAKQVRATHLLLERAFGSPSQPGHDFRGRELARLMWTHLGRLVALQRVPEDLTRDPAVVAAIDAVARGRFNFTTLRRQDGLELAGDFVTVEPAFPDAFFVGSPIPADESGLAVGRTRVGAPKLRELGLLAGASSEEPEAPRAAAQSGAGPAVSGADAEPVTPPGEARPRPADVPAGDGEGAVVSGDRVDRTTPATADANTDAPIRASGEDGPVPPAGASADPEPAQAVPAGDTPAQPADPFALPRDELRQQADHLDEILSGFKLPVQPIDYRLVECGPNLVRFRVRMERAGTIAQVESKARDIQRELASADPILVGQEPPYVTLDVPRPDRIPVTLPDLFPALTAERPSPGELPILLGRSSNGAPGVEDLAQLPHLLVAGTTGSGKSVFLTSLLACLTALHPPSRLMLRIVDIKGLDFAGLSDLPHLRGVPPIEAPDVAIEMLEDLIQEETSRRRGLLRQAGARQITELYQREPDESKWPPQIVVIVDEYAQLLGDSRADRAKLESLVQQYAQFARAFGIYLVLATQRPSVDVVTGPIKANLPARCVFRLPAAHDSRTVIDSGGAESLLGRGDMLFYNDGHLSRYQTPFATPDEVASLANRA